MEPSSGIKSVPLGEFKAQAAKLLKRLGESGEAMRALKSPSRKGVLVRARPPAPMKLAGHSRLAKDAFLRRVPGVRAKLGFLT